MMNLGFEEFREDYLKYCSEARERNEVIHLDVPEGMPSMYVVSSHPGVNEVLKNENNYFVHFADYFDSIPGKSEVDQKIADIFSNNLGNDDPIHNELRKDIRNHFNGAAVDDHGPFIQKCVNALCDSLEKKAKANNGKVELLWDFAQPLAFLVTCHVTGLEFEDEKDRELRIDQAAEAILLINLLATDEEKLVALAAHDELMEFVERQLASFIARLEKDARTDCLLYDFAKNISESGEAKLRAYVEIVGGLFQAGLGVSGSFLCNCLDFLLSGDEFNEAHVAKDYYLNPETTREERREAIFEMIRLTQRRLGGLLPRYSPKGGELMGSEIKEDSLVYMSFVVANRDPQAFKDADKFNPLRSKATVGMTKEEISAHRAARKEKNLSFSFGEHMCPGKRISLVLLQYAYDELFKRFPNMESIEIDCFSEVFGKPSAVLSYHMNLNI